MASLTHNNDYPDSGNQLNSCNLTHKQPNCVIPETANTSRDADSGNADQGHAALASTVLHQLSEIKTMVQGIHATSKPLLSIAEAAELLSVSPRRLANIISLEKKRLGRTPDFVCDAGGVLSMRILRDPLLDWATRKKRGRPALIRREKGRAQNGQ